MPKIFSEEERHGRRSEYDKGCRCDKCVEAKRQHRKALLERGPTKDTVHGTIYAYGALGCRCKKCRERGSEISRNYRNGHLSSDRDADGWIVS